MPSSPIVPSRLLALHEWWAPTSFIAVHYMYFILTCVISAIILWGASTPLHSLPFTDALFLAISAMTLAGLNTVNLSGLNTFQQFVLFLLIMLGSTIFVSIFVVLVRRRAIEREFAHVVKAQHESRLQQRICGMLLCVPSINQSKIVSKRKPIVEMEANDTAVRDRAILPEDYIYRETVNQDPDNYPRARLHDEEQQGQEVLQLQNQSPGRRPPQLSQSLARRNKKYTVNRNGKRPDKTSDNLNTRFANHTTTSKAAGSPDRGYLRSIQASTPNRQGIFSRNEFETQPCSLDHPDTARFISPTNSGPSKESSSTPYISGEQTTSSNSQAAVLTREERDRLGNIEYRALKLLETIIPVYFVLFQLFGCIGVGAWTAFNSPTVAHGNSVNAWWAGAFKAVSAFNNSGLSLFDANMVAFQSAYYVLMTMSFLILAGNTCYPIFLRWIIWVLWKLTPDDCTDYKTALQFVLRYPRRVYILLFPAPHTWFLLGTVVVLNGISWAAFEILDIGNPYIESIPVNFRVIHGLFQAFAVRFGGFHVVPIGSIAIGVQVLYVFMMYIRPYPVLMTTENSDVYERRSLGIYGQEKSAPTKAEPSEILIRPATNNTFFAETGTNSITSFIRQQIRSQFSYDVWWLCLATWLIVIVEGDHWSMDPVTYSVFNIVLEVVSAYGMVGISVGLPNAAYSFCGGWHTLSKLILCVVMLKGRHRDVPVAIDKAVLVPNDSLAPAEEEDAREKASGSAI